MAPPPNRSGEYRGPPVRNKGEPSAVCRRKSYRSLPFAVQPPGGLVLDIETGRVKLTDLASCGGCAAKYSAARLEQLLAGFVPAEAENLLVGLAPADDAAVYRPHDERPLIFPPDLFPPGGGGPGRHRPVAAAKPAQRRFAVGRGPPPPPPDARL